MNIRLLTLIGMVIGAAMTRLIPHPPNFTPIGAIALFGGAYFASRRAAMLVPLAAIYLSSCLLGYAWHWQMLFVYMAFLLIVALGRLLRRRRSALSIATAALTSSILFFVITNFGMWLTSTLYPKTLAGLGACYTAGIPFFSNTIAGDLFFSALLFGGFELAQWQFRSLRVPHAQLA